MLVCVRCHAPYCNKCRAKPFRKQFFLCRRCQTGMYNRRFVALILDTVIFIYVPIFVAVVALAVLGGERDSMRRSLINIVQLIGLPCLLFVRDSLFRGAGPRQASRRACGSCSRRTERRRSPIGQGIVRWLSQFIPFFNLVDVVGSVSRSLAAPLRRPLGRYASDRHRAKARQGSSTRSRGD